ncbi:MAG: acyl-CoA dehydratase activase [Bacillota bacterium]
MTAAGLCIGSSNIKIVELKRNSENLTISKQEFRSHESNVKETLKQLMQNNNLSAKKVAVTGRKFKSLVQVPSISEAEATELAYEYIRAKYDEVDAIISAGAETFMVYELNQEGKTINVYTGNQCASGTGEFFLQQIKRMNLSLEEAMEIADHPDPYQVSDRCSVFCKSDCTHALNKGMDKGRIVAGLCQMMADKIQELLNQSQAKTVMLVGGLAKNQVVIDYLQERLDKLVVPEEAFYFEALGTALWAEKEGSTITELDEMFADSTELFDYNRPLQGYKDKVTFHELEKSAPRDGDECILGLDVGSTTTKAVLITGEENRLIASEYLRTNGDPVTASRECYASLSRQVGEKNISITALGVTGSGRRITGLHALTESVINEIIAHAAGAVYFDPEVDTIFEIGGQDAKYTYLVNGVPTNYAMNEACSAGTGSFLEESAQDFLNIAMEDIAGIALQADNPPNFNDQCSAFIGSDIKNAIQEGIPIPDICAGLVYSICQNYTNKVKGTRPVGNKVFMQGGVCYNEAVPMAMAALTDREIVVPPEPGLMGAFGVALETRRQLNKGKISRQDFDLDELAQREVNHLDDFTCQGGSSDCDRKCKIKVLEISGERHLFGGICDKYMSLNENTKDYDMRSLNLVQTREELLFTDYLAEPGEDQKIKGKIGINRSLLTHSLLPLYSRFFAELGYQVVLPDNIEQAGLQQTSASFCYPVEVSHGYMHDLLKQKEVDYIFLPHVVSLPVENGPVRNILCPVAQGEPYYLSATWPELETDKVLTPVLDFSRDLKQVEAEFISVAEKLDIDKKQAKRAFKTGLTALQDFQTELTEVGRAVLNRLEQEDKKATVIFGRPYNALTSDTNFGIPHKFASQGEIVIPFDMLPAENEELFPEMYWSFGQKLIRGAKFVSSHPRLFGTYITNFSCGPDSFLLNYFRQENGSKPSLTLELDNHTADAGINTRIEAFLEVVDRYREVDNREKSESEKSYSPAQTYFSSGDIRVKTSSGENLSLRDDRVTVVVPSMGSLASRAFAAVLEYQGINSIACEPPGEEELKIGKAHATGKECMPFHLTVGTMLKQIEERSDEQVMVYFMAESSGPCRLGQYGVMMKKIIAEKNIENVAVLSLDCGPGYKALGSKILKRGWQALAITEVLNDVYSAIIALAENPNKGRRLYAASQETILTAMAEQSWPRLKDTLREEAEKLEQIPLVQPLEQAKKVALSGEVYARSDKFSRQHLVEKLARKNIVTIVSPLIEWLNYVDYMSQKTDAFDSPSLFARLKNKLKHRFENHYKNKYEGEIREIFSDTGLYSKHIIDMEQTITTGRELVSDKLTGETIVIIGSGISQIIDEVDGIILIGPFGCLHHRVSESILKDKMEKIKYEKTEPGSIGRKVLDRFSSLPLLAVESDGSKFPQVIEARLEAFYLQVERVNQYVRELEAEE